MTFNNLTFLGLSQVDVKALAYLNPGEFLFDALAVLMLVPFFFFLSVQLML